MARPPKNAPSKSSNAGKSSKTPKASQVPAGPTPAEIVAQEAPLRRRAIICSGVAVLLTIIAVVGEHLLSNKAPDFNQTDLVQTMAAGATGLATPRSFLSVVIEFKIHHATALTVFSFARGIAYALMIPLVLLILRAARVRGGTLGKFLEPIAFAGFGLLAIGTIGSGILEPGVYRHARDLGLTPGAIRDAAKHSAVVLPEAAVTIGALGAGVPLALASIQSYRVGLLPTYVGYMGVLIGFLFILPFLEPTGTLRAVWLSLVAAVLAGGLGGLPPAWSTGEAVMPAPRAPRQPRQPLKVRGGGAAAGGSGGKGGGEPAGKGAGKSAGSKATTASTSAADANATAEAALPHDGPKRPAGKPKAITDAQKGSKQ